MTPENHQSEVLQVVLAEFNALRKEIADRSASASALLNLNLTVTATVAGFVLSNKASPLLLLLLPLLSPSLGMLHVDHAYNIINIGSYIKDSLAPELNQIAERRGLLGYEERIDQYERRKLLRFLPLGLPLILTFSIAPVAALIFVAPSLRAAWAWGVWGFGLLLTIIYLVLWTSFLLLPYRRRGAESGGGE